ncbi:MAG: outer membrane protein assembly factor BamB family protein [Deferrisomatales bacterium]
MRRLAVLGIVLAGCAAGRGEGPSPAGSVAAVAAPAPAIWSMEGGGPGRSSRTAERVGWPLVPRFIAALVANPGYQPEEFAAPVVVGGVAYLGHSGRSFDAVRLTDGEVLWRLPTRGRVYTTAAYAEGLLFFGHDQGEVRAVTPGGQDAWRFPTTYPVVSSPLAAEGRVFVGVADQNVFALEAATGRPLWQYGRKPPHRNALWRSLGLAHGEGRVYAGFSDGAVVALDAEVGRVVWRTEAGAPELFGDAAAGPTYHDGRVYAGVFRGPLVCLDAATGQELWRRDLGLATGFAVGDGRIYAGTAAGAAAALAAADGATLWEASLSGGVPTAPVLAPNALLVGASDGGLHLLDPATGKERGRYDPGPGLHAQPVAWEGGVLLFSDGGSLHRLR